MKLTLLAVALIVLSIASAAAVFAFSTLREPPATTAPASPDKAPMNTPPSTTTKTAASSPKYSKSGYDVTPLTEAQIQKLATKLTKEEAAVILDKGTERPFCEGTLSDNHKDGIYVCRLCALPLFASDAKFDSGTGWPSFFKPYDPAHVDQQADNSHGMKRIEINCARCGGHLGHVFEDGPRPTGLRFCLNSASLEFVENKDGKPNLPAASQPLKTETAYFAGGCFWGVEDRFQQLPGVIDAASGYMGGKTKNPSYEDVCTHTTGHAETVKVVFDPAKITYPQLLEKFFKFHDPTQLNRQGPDIGDSYRSAIFTTTPDQAAAVKAFIEQQSKTDRFKSRKIVTQIEDAAKAGPFYMAEDYHQDYDAKHGKTCPLPAE